MDGFLIKSAVAGLLASLHEYTCPITSCPDSYYLSHFVCSSPDYTILVLLLAVLTCLLVLCLSWSVLSWSLVLCPAVATCPRPFPLCHCVLTNSCRDRDICQIGPKISPSPFQAVIARFWLDNLPILAWKSQLVLRWAVVLTLSPVQSRAALVRLWHVFFPLLVVCVCVFLAVMQTRPDILSPIPGALNVAEYGSEWSSFFGNLHYSSACWGTLVPTRLVLKVHSNQCNCD